MKKDIWLIFLVTVIAVWNTTYKLEVQPLYLWDESRQANNALEMAASGNFAYTTYENQPDLWNTKPHFLVFLQAVLIKTLDPGILSIRLPSALAAAFTVVLWFVFLYRRKLYTAAFLFVLIILSSKGFNAYHIARTGDYDALLVFFISAILISFYKAIEQGFSRKRIVGITILFVLAILTKSLAALLWLPIFALLFFVFSNQRKEWIKALVIPFGSAIAVVMVYYIIHEKLTPGYLKAVWNNEITGRYLLPNEGHQSHWYYYAVVLFNQYFKGFICVLAVALFGVKFITERNKRVAPYLGIAVVFFVFIISISATRIHWYLAPAIPILSVILALLLGALLHSRVTAVMYYGIALLMATIFVSFWQFRSLWKENLAVEDVHPQYVLQQAVVNCKMPHQGWWMYEGYRAIENYYGNLLNQKDTILRITETPKFSAKDTVFIYRFNQTDSIHKYNFCRQLSPPTRQVPVWVFVVDSAKRF